MAAMSEIRFFIPGIPSPGGSKSAFCLKKDGVYTGRAVVVDAGGAKTKLWRQDAAKAAFIAMKDADLAPSTCAIEVELIIPPAPSAEPPPWRKCHTFTSRCSEIPGGAA